MPGRWFILMVVGTVLGAAVGDEYVLGDRKRDPECRSGNACHVSMFRLIARPEVYHERRVQVQGRLIFGKEARALVPAAEMLDHKAAIWLEPASKIDVPNGAHVTIEGVYDALHNGHYSNFSGTLQIERIVVHSLQ